MQGLQLTCLMPSLVMHGLDSIAFISDMTKVMKGARLGVQKNEHHSFYDVGCICHLADLTVKAGLKGLLIDLDQLFIDVFYNFHYSSKRKQEFVDLWCSLFTGEAEVILKHCPTHCSTSQLFDEICSIVAAAQV